MQRRSEIVRNGVGKCFQLFIDGRELIAAVSQLADEPLLTLEHDGVVELHGGLGFTWECDVHIWFKRVMFDRLWLGAPELHRERYAALEGW